MSDSETPDFDVIPANNNCSSQSTVVVTSNQGSPVSNASTNVTNVNNQHLADSQYDTINSSSIQPMYGGNQQKFNVVFKEKVFTILSNDPLKAVKISLNKKVFKKDYLVDVYMGDKLVAKYIKRRNYNTKYERII
jgi:hypothetical protein